MLITLATPRQNWTGSNPSRREGGGCGVTLSRSHSCCAVRLVYTQISPGHIWTTLYNMIAAADMRCYWPSKITSTFWCTFVSFMHSRRSITDIYHYRRLCITVVVCICSNLNFLQASVTSWLSPCLILCPVRGLNYLTVISHSFTLIHAHFHSVF